MLRLESLSAKVKLKEKSAMDFQGLLSKGRNYIPKELPGTKYCVKSISVTSLAYTWLLGPEYKTGSLRSH